MGHIRYDGTQLGEVSHQSSGGYQGGTKQLYLCGQVALLYMTVFCGISPIGVAVGMALKEVLSSQTIMFLLLLRGRCPALVNPYLKPFLNLHVNLHVNKKVHLKVHVNHDFHVNL